MTDAPIQIDGSRGEGGGQILRTALSLSLVTGAPFRIDAIRAGRQKPGILRQHLTAVEAAAELCGASVSGAAIGSKTLSFAPARRPVGGDYRFAVGTAGSATLVLQTVLPALVLAEGPSSVAFEGGTHNPFAPPWDFLARAFLPLLGRMGPRVGIRLERHGFYPAGGGRFTVTVQPSRALAPIDLLERGPIVRRRARALVANLPVKIAERELSVLRARLGLSAAECAAEEIPSPGPGNIVMVEVECGQVVEVFTGFGQKGVPAEKVAEGAARECRDWTDAGVPVGVHLADQLLVPMALAGGGRYRTLRPSPHTTTNVEVIRQFLEIDVAIEPAGEACQIAVRSRRGGGR